MSLALMTDIQQVKNLMREGNDKILLFLIPFRMFKNCLEEVIREFNENSFQ